MFGHARCTDVRVLTVLRSRARLVVCCARETGRSLLGVWMGRAERRGTTVSAQQLRSVVGVEQQAGRAACSNGDRFMSSWNGSLTSQARSLGGGVRESWILVPRGRCRIWCHAHVYREPESWVHATWKA